MLSRISLRSSGLRHPTTKNLSPPLHHTLSSPSPRPPRGRFMRRSWGGTNRRSGVEIRACQIRWLVLGQILGIPAGAAPAPAASHAAVPGGLGAPPGITTGPCREPADREASRLRKSAARGRQSAAVERRLARRPSQRPRRIARCGSLKERHPALHSPSCSRGRKWGPCPMPHDKSGRRSVGYLGRAAWIERSDIRVRGARAPRISLTLHPGYALPRDCTNNQHHISLATRCAAGANHITSATTT